YNTSTSACAATLNERRKSAAPRTPRVRTSRSDNARRRNGGGPMLRPSTWARLRSTGASGGRNGCRLKRRQAHQEEKRKHEYGHEPDSLIHLGDGANVPNQKVTAGPS